MKKQLRIFALGLAVVLSIGAESRAQTVQDGLRFLDLEQFSNARKAFNQAYSQTPTATTAYYMGYFYLQYEKLDEQGVFLDSAKYFFEKGQGIDPKYALNFVGLGTYKLAKGDKAGAKTLFDQAISMTKNKNAEVLHRVGEAYISYPAKDAEAAIVALEKASTIEKQNTDIMLTAGDAYLAKSQTEAGNAATRYDRAIGANPKLAKAYIRRGDIMKGARNYQQALDDYKKGIDSDPNYYPAYRQLGELYFLAGRYKEASDSYKKFIDNSDFNPRVMYKYGAFLYLNGNFAESLEVLKGLEGKLDNPVRYRLMGYDQFELKDCPAGLANIEKFFSVFAADKLSAKDYEYRGKLEICVGKDTMRALESMLKAVKIDSTRASEVIEFGNELFKAKKYEQAAIVYEKYINTQTQPKVNDYFTLGRAHYFGKDYVKADSAFAKVNRIKEDPIGVLYRARSSSRIDAEQKDGLAKPHYERYLELAGSDEKNKENILESNAYLGFFYYKQFDINKKEDDKKKAIDFCQKVVENDEKGKYKNAVEILEFLTGKPITPKNPDNKNTPKK
ncbi:MAG: tetratricopeptide repeat protein [Thermonemataceae bacterium]|nr:tetratricopeptide repeat protein [Thermonemataceae bacterium]